MKNRTKEILLVIMVLILQTIIYVFVAKNKSYLHIDEAYSFGLSNYDKIEIQDNDDFYNTWHSKDYYLDYLAVQKDEIWDFKPVYENQKNDVHPPLYYLLLRFCMIFTSGHFSIWSGIVLNIIIYVFVTIFMYLILKRLFRGENFANVKAIVLAFMSSIILASLSNVINIRMYALSTLNVLITTFLHIKLFESKDINVKLFIAIGVSALAGVLTHYFYLFFLAVLYIIFLIRYIREKQFKKLLFYTLTLIFAGVFSLMIFPYSLNHMFFGYRGQGVISNFENIFDILPSIYSQLYTLNYYAFNGLLPVIIIIMIALFVYNKLTKRNFKFDKDTKGIFNVIFIPTILFFIITSVSSPWKVLRYIVPVCGLAFILMIFCFYKLLQPKFGEKMSNILVCVFLCIVLISPFVLHLKPELLYNDRKEIVQKLSGDLNLPVLYFYSSNGGGFLDDIFVFSKLNDSYIARDLDCTDSNLQKIFEGKDISKGLLIFMNGDQDYEYIINVVESSLNFENCEQLQSLSSCQVYYVH